MKVEYENFYDLLKYLKKILDVPISVKRVNMPQGIDGDCQLMKNNKFLIRIEKKLPEYYAIDVLLHEIPHCLSWNHDKDDHGPSWGIAYSKVYRLFLEWLK
jgi:hypothetical protein